MFQQVEQCLGQVYNVLELLDMLFCQLFELIDVYNDEIDLDEDDKDKFEAKNEYYYCFLIINRIRSIYLIIIYHCSCLFLSDLKIVFLLFE